MRSLIARPKSATGPTDGAKEEAMKKHTRPGHLRKSLVTHPEKGPGFVVGGCWLCCLPLPPGERQDETTRLQMRHSEPDLYAVCFEEGGLAYVTAGTLEAVEVPA